MLTILLMLALAADPPTVPIADQAAYWKELATFHFLDSQLQQALKNASALDQQKAAQQVKVDAAKQKLEKGCGADKQLDEQKFAQGEIVCTPKPKKQ